MQNNISLDALAKELKRSKLKLTYPRKQIFSVLQKANRPLSIKELESQLLDVNQVTIYRNIHTLAKFNIINKLPYGFKYRYELSETFNPHHHHAVCSMCGKSHTIKSEQIEYLLDEAAIMAGIKPESHHIEVIGVCASCQKTC